MQYMLANFNAKFHVGKQFFLHIYDQNNYLLKSPIYFLKGHQLDKSIIYFKYLKFENHPKFATMTRSHIFLAKIPCHPYKNKVFLVQ